MLPRALPTPQTASGPCGTNNFSVAFSAFFFFFFNDPAPPETSPLPLHDALPIWFLLLPPPLPLIARAPYGVLAAAATSLDRKSTRLNSSHLGISYAVFCLKK